MTQEEKELLLKDLCARLPYKVMIKHPNGHCKLESYEYGRLNSVFIYVDEIYLSLDTHDECDFILNEKIKPYLRSMSSMTEGEKEEYKHLQTNYEFAYFDNVYSIDWLNKKMFDYRGLIPMGLALEAPKDMYK